MIAEAIQTIRTIVTQANAVQKFEIGDRTYTDKPLTEVPNSLPALPKSLAITTLGGFVDAVKAHIENFANDGVLVHVCGPDLVTLIDKTSDKWGRCKNLITAKPIDVRVFNFGEYIDHENFLIGVQAAFTADGDREYLLKIAANITAESVTTSENDGVSQKIGVRQGVALKTTETLRSRVTLAPFRTFREVEQPASEFIFRVKQEGQSIPRMALFEADGGKWRIDAMERIASYLSAEITDIPVIA